MLDSFSHLFSLKLIFSFMLLKLQINCRNNGSAYIMAYGKLVEWKSFIELISNMHLSLLHTKISVQGNSTGNKDTFIQKFSFKIQTTFPIIPVVIVCMHAADAC